MTEGMNLIKVYCKHIWKCHNETPVQRIYANKNIKRGHIHFKICSVYLINLVYLSI
jgi:hypothetical protein